MRTRQTIFSFTMAEAPEKNWLARNWYGIFFSILFVIFLISVCIPRLKQPDFQLNSATLNSTHNVSELSANWNFTFLVKDRNHLSTNEVSYNQFQVNIYNSSDYSNLLTVTNMTNVEQDKVNERLALSASSVNPERILEVLGNNMSSSVSFDVNVFVNVAFPERLTWWRARQSSPCSLIVVSCQDLGFGLSTTNNGSWSLMGGPRSCKVKYDLFKKIRSPGY